MKEYLLRNILIYFILVIFPYIISYIYNSIYYGDFVFALQYMLLVISCLGSLIIFFYNIKYLKHTQKVIQKLSASFILLSILSFVFGLFIVLFLISTSHGIGF